ncbi:guanosine monophosphate reductase [Lujinxingia litoralis]|uniref:Guanosine monophosphate reductase n=1 Tax=Lujinxingia litoralis TaxID=2211119 RepID=A0A328CBD4_9DELT|nr:IMP dehydrogenase [Lujinxingia litoralis]RAL23799.1 guanosine monophosphate reductase [Lujinxingia litoralis]
MNEKFVEVGPWGIALTYEDVLLVPAESAVLPAQASLATTLGAVALQAPILSAAMDSVTEARMARRMAELGGIGVIHKNLSIEDQAAQVRAVKEGDASLQVGAAIGVGRDRDARADALVRAGVDLLVIDTAHGHSRGVIEATRALRARLGAEITLVAGNVATAAAAQALLEAGADVIKVGVGPGSICTTRVVAGVGVPQLSAVLACARICREAGKYCIADGGISRPGDVAKALAAGAHAVMVGGLLAGSDEAPGERVRVGGRDLKAYRGMGSEGAMRAGSAERYFQDQSAQKLVAEGVEAFVPYRGAVADQVFELLGGLRSAMGYLGAATLEELYERARFVRISSAGLRESHVHDVMTLTPQSEDPGDAHE